jgi:HEAT repeat protein
MIRSMIGVLLLLPAAGCGESESTPKLVERLGNADSAVRLTAVKTLGRRTGDAATVVPALADRLLHDDDLYVRRDSANALGGLGPAAKPAWAALAETARKDREPRVRKVAIAALKKIDPDAASRDGFR